MKQFHGILKDDLEENGKIKKFKKIIDYHKMQKYGTCTAQTILAAFRQIIHEEVQGSDFHKQGVHSLVKYNIKIKLIDQNWNKTDIKSQNAAKQQLEKYQELLGLIELNKDSKKFEEHFNLLKQAFASGYMLPPLSRLRLAFSAIHFSNA